MGQDIRKQIGQLLVYLKDKDPNIRYKALHKLNSALFQEEYEVYHENILSAISHVAARDLNDRVRNDARNILYMFNPPDRTSGKKLKIPSRSLFVMSLLVILFIMLIFLFFPMKETEKVVEEKKEVTERIVENKKKYELWYRVHKRFRDHVKVEIKNKVFFRGNPLFTNLTKFKLERRIKEIYADGAFVMQQKITEGSGIASDLHPFGYPNPGENLLITYDSNGSVKSLRIGRKKLSNKLKLNFSKLIFPQKKLSMGDTWREESDPSAVAGFKLNNILYASDYKLMQVLYQNKLSDQAYNMNNKIESDTKGEIYIDFDTGIPLLTKMISNFTSRSRSTTVSLSSVVTITEASSRLDRLKLKIFLGDHVGAGSFHFSMDKSKPGKGVTD